MAERDWRGLVDGTIDRHLASLRSTTPDEERDRRARAGGELHLLALWTERSAAALASGATRSLEGPVATDPPWIALAKLELRRACATGAARDTLPLFRRALESRRRSWQERARELLAGSPAPEPKSPPTAPGSPVREPEPPAAPPRREPPTGPPPVKEPPARNPPVREPPPGDAPENKTAAIREPRSEPAPAPPAAAKPSSAPGKKGKKPR